MTDWDGEENKPKGNTCAIIIAIIIFAVLFLAFLPNIIINIELSMKNVPKYMAQLDSSLPSERIDGAQWLGWLGPDAREAIPKLFQLLDDDDPEVSRQATYAISRIGINKDQIPLAVGRLRSDDPTIHGVCREKLIELGEDALEALPTLVETVDGDLYYYQELEANLSSFGTPMEVAEKLDYTLRSKDEDIQLRSIRLIEELGYATPDSVLLLIELAESSTDKHIAATAKRALSKLESQTQ